MQDQRAADLERLGVDPATAAAWLAEQDCVDEGDEGDGGPPLAPELQAGGPPLRLWPENHAVLRLWLQLENRWHLAWNGRRLALNMSEAAALINLQRLKHPRRLTRQLLEMETEALTALDEGA